MGASETDEIAGELYLVPPAGFVAARDELVRKARAAGNRELARALQSLRRPTRSAWLVNLLTRHERAPMESLAALGRQLRQAQRRLDATQLRHLSAQRQQMIADLLDRARRRSAEAGLEPTDAVLSEVEATLHAALVDLAAASTVLSGRLVRPMSHSGFGPMPQVDAAATSPPPSTPALGPMQDADLSVWPVEDKPQGQTAAGPGGSKDVEREWPRSLEEARQQRRRAAEAKPAAAGQETVRRAEAALAAAESTHWQREHELADAEAAAEAARDRLQWLDQQRMEARAGKATADRHLSEARSGQRAAIRAVAEARRLLEVEQTRLRSAAEQPPSRGGED